MSTNAVRYFLSVLAGVASYALVALILIGLALVVPISKAAYAHDWALLGVVALASATSAFVTGLLSNRGLWIATAVAAFSTPLLTVSLFFYLLPSTVAELASVVLIAVGVGAIFGLPGALAARSLKQRSHARAAARAAATGNS